MGYGLTEAGPNTFWLPIEHTKSKIGSVGRPLFHVDVKLLDEAGVEVGPEEVSHLLILGPHVFGGYCNRPEATSETIVDGRLHTGDLARRDADGDYYIAGRINDMIKSGWENIYPSEVEDEMHSHPAIAEAALIPKSDSKWGEVGLAVVVLKPNASMTDAALIDWLRDLIPITKCLSQSYSWIHYLKQQRTKLKRNCWSNDMRCNLPGF